MPIIDNFDSQFISEVTETTNGIMSSFDKTKLDGILLEDLDYIKNNLEEINEYMIPQFIYGIKIDTTNPDSYTSVEYTDDSLGFIPLSVDQATGACNYGSWKNIIDNIFGIAPCLLKRDGSILTYLNPDNYNQTIDGTTIDIESGLGQVMIRFKHLYYKFSVDGNKLWFQISNKQTDSTWVDTAFASEDGIGTVRKEMYIAAYESCLENNILQSLSNKTPSFNLSFEEIESQSEFGVFHMMNITKKQFIIFLGYLITKSIDLESKIGNGNIAGSLLKSGSMNTKGLFYGKSTNIDGVKLFGIENLWGNQLKYMHGLIQKMAYVIQNEEYIEDQRIYAKKFFPYNNIDDFDEIKSIEPNISGYISKVEFLNDSIHMPISLSGSSSTYYKSFFENGKSLDTNNKLYSIYGGSNIYGNKSGPEFLLLAYVDKDTTQVTTHIIY